MPLTNIEIETMTLVKAACRKYTEEKNRVAPIDWEQRRYEIAKAVAAQQVFTCTDTDGVTYNAVAARQCVEFADALIEELKK